MEKINNLQHKENNIEKGENVVIHAVFTRHGEKEHDPNNPETALTLNGEWNSRKFGQNRPKSDIIKPYSSKTLRTEKTAEYSVEQSSTRKKGNLQLRKELGFVYDAKGEFLKNVLKIKSDILGKDDNLSKEEFDKRLHKAMSKQVDYYLNFGDQRPDPKTYSPVETASGIARLLDKYIRMSGELKSGLTVDLINATHDFNLATFLKEVMVRKIDDKKVRGFKSIEEIGGPTDFNENFEVIINRKNERNVTVKMIFRDQEYEIDMKRMKELVQIAKELEK